MNLPGPLCVLIADSRHERFPLVAYQWAALRGIRCWRMDLATGDFSASGLAPKALLALSYPTLTSFNPAELFALKIAVRRGATLYVRGGFSTGQRCALTPFGSGAFVVGATQRTGGYRLADHWLLPQVLRNEVSGAALDLPAAHTAEGTVQALASRLGAGAGELAFICAIPCGGGVVIYDLMPDEVALGAAAPIAKRLADPAARCFDLGALAAVNHASGRPAATLAQYNLVLDDRPRNLDYFNVARVTRWLAQVERSCPGTHVDLLFNGASGPSAAGFQPLAEGKIKKQLAQDLTLASGDQVFGFITDQLGPGYDFTAYVIWIPGLNKAWCLNLVDQTWSWWTSNAQFATAFGNIKVH